MAGKLHPRAENILNTIRAFPDGLQVTDLYELHPEYTDKDIGNTVTTLTDIGSVSAEILRPNGVGRSQRRVTFLAEIGKGTRPIKEPKPRVATSNGLAVQLEEARQQIAELEEWKREALSRYPDLAVDPTILEARKIVSATLREDGDIQHANDVMSGRKDRSPLIRAVVFALENGA